MMTVVRKNQLILVVIGVIAVSIAYLHYATTEDTLPVIDEISDPLLTDKLETEVFKSDEELVEQNIENSYFEEARIERDRTREQEIYMQEIVINNIDENKEEHKKAQEELTKIGEKMEKELITENMIKAKGFKDVVVFINDNLINVIVDNGGKEIDTPQMTQIKECIITQIGTEYDLKIISK